MQTKLDRKGKFFDFWANLIPSPLHSKLRSVQVHENFANKFNISIDLVPFRSTQNVLREDLPWL